MPNMNQILSNHNKKILNKINHSEEEPSKTCNCRNTNVCPLNGHCLDDCVVYEATVTQTQTNKQDTYIGLTENTFKTRYNLHKSSFKLPHKRNATCLSERIWELKDKSIDHTIKWTIIKRLIPLRPGNRTCQLCLHEKYEILKREPTLNKKKELFNTCRHKTKWMLANTGNPTKCASNQRSESEERQP